VLHAIFEDADFERRTSRLPRLWRIICPRRVSTGRWRTAVRALTEVLETPFT